MVTFCYLQQKNGNLIERIDLKTCNLEGLDGRIEEFVKHIMNLYDKMKIHHIPFIDSLDKVKIEGQSVPFVILSPKGIQYKPQSEKQLVIALHCVLTAFEVFFCFKYYYYYLTFKVQ